MSHCRQSVGAAARHHVRAMRLPDWIGALVRYIHYGGPRVTRECC